MCVKNSAPYVLHLILARLLRLKLLLNLTVVVYGIY